MHLRSQASFDNPSQSFVFSSSAAPAAPPGQHFLVSSGCDQSIQKLSPNVSWHTIGRFPQLGGLKLASLTHQKLYGQEGLEGADGVLAVRDEYLAWVMEGRRPLE